MNASLISALALSLLAALPVMGADLDAEVKILRTPAGTLSAGESFELRDSWNHGC